MKKRRKEQIRAAILIVMAVVVMFSTVSKMTLTSKAATTTSYSYTVALQVSESGGYTTIECVLPPGVSDTTNITYTWTETSPSGTVRQFTGGNSFTFNTSSYQGYSYSCVATGSINSFYNLVTNAYQNFMHRDPDSTGFSSHWARVIGQAETGWTTMKRHYEAMLYCTNRNNIAFPVNVPDMTWETYLGTAPSITGVLGTGGYINDAAAMAGAMIVSIEYLLNPNDSAIYTVDSSNTFNVMDDSQGAAIKAAGKGFFGYVGSETDTDFGYYTRSGEWKGGSFPATAQAAYPNTPRSLIYDCYCFLLGREPSDAEINSWLQVYAASSSSRTSTTTEYMNRYDNDQYGFTWSGLSHYQTAAGYGAILAMNKGILDVINGIAGSQECENYMSKMYSYSGGTFTYSGNMDEQNIFQFTVTSDTYTVPVTYYTLTVNKGSNISAVTGGGTYAAGTRITVTATANTGYTFSGWTSSDGNYNGTTASYTITMPSANLTLTANATASTNTKYTVRHWQQNIGGTASSHDSSNYTLAETENKTGTTAAKVTPAVKSYTGFTAPSTQTVTIAADGSTVVDYYYTRNSYTVTLNKGTGISAVSGAGSYQYGASVTINATVSTGYTWSKWSGTHSTTTQKYTFTMPASNVTDTANATANTNTKYTVRHWQQNIGGTASSHDSSNYTLAETENKTGTTAASVTPAVKSYTGFTAPSTQTVTIAGDGSTVVDYYYTRNSYTVTLNKGTGISAVSGAGSYQYGASVTINATVSTGYTWSKWSGTHSTTTQKYTFTMPAGNVTDTANATGNNYTLTLDPNGGTLPGASQFTLTLNSGNYCDISWNLPTQTGYTFKGWYTAKTGGIQVYGADGICTNEGTYWKDSLCVYASDYTVYAQWTANTGTKYVVNHYQQNIADDNYTLKETENLTGTTAAKVTPAVKSYTGFTAPSTQTVTIAGDGSTVVNYYYTRNSYTVTLNKETGISEVSGAGTYRYGASVTINATVATGYTWSSWSGTHSTTTQSYTFTMPAANVTDTANATVITYSISYTLNGGTVSGNPTSYTVETASFTLNNPTRTGYTFTGWTGSNGTTLQTSVTIAKGSTGNRSYTANWTANTNTKYTVRHWQQNIGGTASSHDSSNYTLAETENKTGTTAASVTPAVKSYTGFTAPSTQTVTIAADGSTVVDYYYTRNSYTVTLNKETGITAVSGAGTYQYGASVTINATVTTGYSWSNWSGTHSTTTQKYTFTMPAGNVTDTANAEVITYSISYTLNGGTVSGNPTSYTVETASFTLNNPTRTGYTFTGWTGSNGTTAQTTVSIGKGSTGDRSYTANWKANTNTKYTVRHWQQNIGGTASSHDSSNYTLAETENKTGTTAASVTPEVKSYAGFTAPSTQTVTIEADGSTVVDYYYTRNSYTLTLNKGTGISAVSGEGTYQYGASVTIDATVATGYSWTKWSGTHSTTTKKYTFTMPAGNVTDTASATAITYSISYNLSGGSVSGSNPTSYTVETDTFTLINPTRSGYTFSGWTGTNGTTPQTSVTITKGSTGDRSYTANWKDTTPPNLSLSMNPTVWTKGNVVVTATATDGQSGMNTTAAYNWNGTGWVNSSTYTATENGTVTCIVRDAEGNQSEQKSIEVWNIDRTPPEASLTADPDEWTNGDVVITCTASDSQSGLHATAYNWNGTGYSNDNTYTVTANGTYSVVVKDAVGNETKKTITIGNVDKTDPEIPDTSSGGNTFYIDDTPVVTIEINDTISGVAEGQAVLKNQDGETKTYTISNGVITIPLKESGICNSDCTIEVYAKDNAGNTQTGTFYVKDNRAPEVTLTQDPTEWTNGNVTLTVEAVDTGFGLQPVPYSWDNGVTWTTSETFTATENGTYTVLVRDRAGTPNIGSAEITVTNIDRVPPVISGMDDFRDMTLIDRNEGNKTMYLEITDDASGVKEATATIYNYDNGQSRTYTADADGKITINLTEDHELFYGDFKLTVEAWDNAGNYSEDVFDTTEFSLDTSLKRILEPHTPIFKCGESGILTVDAGGYVDKIVVEFPSDIAWTKTYSQEITYDDPAYIEHVEIQFMIPLYTTEKDYTITITSYKDGEALQTRTETFTVSGTVLDELRTRLR